LDRTEGEKLSTNLRTIFFVVVVVVLLLSCGKTSATFVLKISQSVIIFAVGTEHPGSNQGTTLHSLSKSRTVKNVRK
jgi:hypothetical protein